MHYRLHDLTIGYEGKTVASHITATLGESKLTALLGPNGAGKSTLLRTMAGFTPKLAGTLSLDGQDISALTPRQASLRVSVVLTDRITASALTVNDVASMGRSPYTNRFGRLTDADRLATAKALQTAGIAHLAGRRLHTLSDGERQKTMIAKALAQETPAILLDEPTAFLDFPSKVELMLLLRSLCHNEGKTILLTTHDLDLALQASDTLWLLDSHGTLTQGTPAQLAQSGALASAFSTPHARFDPASMRFRLA